MESTLQPHYEDQKATAILRQQFLFMLRIIHNT